MFVLNALVQFLDHEDHQIEFVLVVIQVDENVSVQQKVTHFFVRVPGRTFVEIVPKIVAKVVFAMGLIVYLPFAFVHVSHHLLYVRDVILIVFEALYQSLVDVFVGVVRQRFQDQHRVNVEHRFVVFDAQFGTTGCQEVDDIHGRRVIGLNASDQHADVAEMLSFVFPGVSLHHNRIVFPCQHQHSNQFLVAVYDEVATPFIFVLSMVH